MSKNTSENKKGFHLSRVVIWVGAAAIIIAACGIVIAVIKKEKTDPVGITVTSSSSTSSSSTSSSPSSSVQPEGIANESAEELQRELDEMIEKAEEGNEKLTSEQKAAAEQAYLKEKEKNAQEIKKIEEAVAEAIKNAGNKKEE